MTYDDWYLTYMTLYKRKLAEKTRESYARLHQLLTPIHAKQLEELTPDLLQAALIGVESAAGSRQAQLAYTLLHSCLQRAARSRHIAYNPADALDKPEHEGSEGRSISDADWRLLAPEIRGDVAFSLMAFAGLRRGEALALRRADVNQASGLIRVSRQRLRVGGRLITLAPKSKSGVRDVPILPEMAAVLQQQPLMLPNALYVPCSPETLGRRWRRAQLRAGVEQPYRLHDLRHTYATRLVAAGVNPRILQYMIGHASLDLTMSTYTHIDGHIAVNECSRVREFLH